MMSCVWVNGCRSRTRCHLLPGLPIFIVNAPACGERGENSHTQEGSFQGSLTRAASEPVLDSNADEVNVARAASGVSDFV